MTEHSNLDDYLAGLGISDADERAMPAVTAEPAPLLDRPHNDPQTVLEQFFTGLIRRMDPSLTFEMHELEGAFEVEISGERASALAGKDGRTLQAIEIIAYTVLTKQTGHNDLRLRVDMGGFRKRQAETLAKLAERLAAQVAKSGEPHELQPMNAADRRVIHMTLKENPDVVTESVGEGAARRLIIRPAHH